MKKLFFILTLLWMGNAAAAEVKILPSLPMYGVSKYAPDFKHFDYVNPQAPQGGRLVLPAYGGFDNFNPFIFKGIATPEPAGLTLESLGISAVDDPSTVYPLLAEKFELADDGSFIGFILNPQARFADGSPVSADDVIFSFNALLEKGAPLYKVYYGDVERVEKVNDRQVRFHIKKGTQNRELPLILSQFKIYSAKDWEGKDFAVPNLIPPLGSGPYRLDKFAPGKYLVFKKNPHYWGRNLPTRKGFFNFEEIRYDYYQDTTVTLQALFAGSIDMREEYIAKIWVSGYHNDLVRNGTVIKEELQHNQPAVLQFFGFNTRLKKFADPRVREAVGLAFNFDWANEKLFYNQYRRIFSYFTNTGMEAKGVPQGEELRILEKYRGELPPEVFGDAPKLPSHKTPQETRDNLRRAVRLLQEAGYDFVDGKMTHLQSGEALEIEVLSNAANGSSFTRVMLPFIENLKKIGIKMTFRNLEVNIFKNRLDLFDFEMAILSFRMSEMPGTEQREMWGSAAADVKGSYNVMGIKNPVADKIIDGLIAARSKNSFEAHVKALDRVLRHEHYLIPQWYSPFNRVAYRRKFERPKTEVKAGFNPFTWWVKEEK